METLQAFYSVINRGQEKRHKLTQQLNEDKKALRQYEREYNESVLADDDKKADELFKTIYELKQNIENNSKKLEIISADNSVKTKEVEKSAVQVVEDAQNALESLEEEQEERTKELEDIMEAYFTKVEEIGSVCESIREQHQYIDRVMEYLPDDKKPKGYHPKLGYHHARRAARDFFQYHKYKIEHDPLILNAFHGKRQEGKIRQ